MHLEEAQHNEPAVPTRRKNMLHIERQGQHQHHTTAKTAAATTMMTTTITAAAAAAARVMWVGFYLVSIAGLPNNLNATSACANSRVVMQQL